MDWTLAIDRNRDALLRLLAMLLTMVGGEAVVARHRHVAAWRILRPLEAALRRLIVVAKAVWKIEARGAVPRGVGGIAVPRGAGAAVPAFALFDARKSFAARRVRRGEPRIRFFDDVEIFEPVVVVLPDDLVSAARLSRRLLAVQRALGDLRGQARRMARWEAKRAAGRASSGKYIAPIRPGKPPGHRDRGRHPVDFVLSDCHALALYVAHDPP